MIRHATRLVALSAALGLLSGAALAQTKPAAPAAPAAPAQPKPPAPAAPAQTFTPSHLALAREVALASGITRTFDAIVPQFGARIKQSAVSRPELTKDLDDVLKKLEPELELQKQQMINTTGRVFASKLTEAELKEVSTFFKSPAGKKYVEVQPVILDELVKEISTWTDQVAEYVMIRVRAEMGKRGHMMQ